jgi:hypothetical protein
MEILAAPRKYLDETGERPSALRSNGCRAEVHVRRRADPLAAVELGEEPDGHVDPWQPAVCARFRRFAVM